MKFKVTFKNGNTRETIANHFTDLGYAFDIENVKIIELIEDGKSAKIDTIDFGVPWQQARTNLNKLIMLVNNINDKIEEKTNGSR